MYIQAESCFKFFLLCHSVVLKRAAGRVTGREWGQGESVPGVGFPETVLQWASWGDSLPVVQRLACSAETETLKGCCCEIRYPKVLTRNNSHPNRETPPWHVPKL